MQSVNGEDGERLKNEMCFVSVRRNTAAEAVQQELLFVGQESGKLMAVRNIVHEVMSCRLWVVL